MDKSKIIAISIILIVLLFPFKIFAIRDGGSFSAEPILPIYKVIILHQIYSTEPLLAHNDPNYKEPTERSYRKGFEIYIFGHKATEYSYISTQPIVKK